MKVFALFSFLMILCHCNFQDQSDSQETPVQEVETPVQEVETPVQEVETPVQEVETTVQNEEEDFEVLPEQSEESITEDNIKTKSNEFSGKLEPLPKPHQYRIVLQWNLYEPQGLWSLYEKKDGSSPRLMKVFPSGEGEACEDHFEPGRSYQYFIKSTAHQESLLKTDAFIIPSDLEVTKPIKTSEILVNRLFMKKGSKMVTQGKSIKIHVNEIISDKGVVDTSPPKSSLSPGAHGKSCGSIDIRTKKASGILHLVCHPGKGVDGSNGANGKDGKMGEQGSAGDIAVKPESAPNTSVPPERLKAMYIKAGPDGLLPNQIRLAPRDWKFWFYCSQKPGDGSPGEPGKNGEDGMDGGNGGNTARTLVRVEEESDFKVTRDYVQADGGCGGRGGNPGKGGLGGLPGKDDPSGGIICPHAKSGPKGPDGLLGKSGRYGAPSKVLPFCIKIGSQTKGDCYDFDEVNE